MTDRCVGPGETDSSLGQAHTHSHLRLVAADFKEAGVGGSMFCVKGGLGGGKAEFKDIRDMRPEQLLTKEGPKTGLDEYEHKNNPDLELFYNAME